MQIMAIQHFYKVENRSMSKIQRGEQALEHTCAALDLHLLGHLLHKPTQPPQGELAALPGSPFASAANSTHHPRQPTNRSESPQSPLRAGPCLLIVYIPGTASGKGDTFNINIY